MLKDGCTVITPLNGKYSRLINAYGIDKFNRFIEILCLDEILIYIKVENTPLYKGFDCAFIYDTMQVAIWTNKFIKYPKWWQFWRKKVSPHIVINL